MKNLFNTADVALLKNRIEQLTPASQRKWGKMQVAQMLAHCNAAMEVATAKKFPPRIFIGRIIGPLVKPAFFNERPFTKNAPTDKSFVIKDERDFAAEKNKLLNLIQQFADNGEAGVTTHPHSFFGKLTPTEWARGMYKHIEHHLVQFGV